MTDQTDPRNQYPDDQDQHLPSDSGDYPVQQEPSEALAPRRAASAQFVVDAEIGSEAALREAMDPATQSLADALRLSFRILQLVIIVLIGMFFLSGFQTVGENQSGVLTRWGKIVPVAGQESLEPGLRFSWLPYPASEFIVIDIDNRTVDVVSKRSGQLRDAFWPFIDPNLNLEQATASARVHEPIRPDRSGYLLTRDGDIAHMRLNAKYEIVSPADYLRRVRDQDADQVVSLALRRAAVHVASSMSLQEIIDNPDELRHGIQMKAQEVLASLYAGIQLDSVNVTQTIAPLAIRATYGEVQSAQVESERAIENARQRANQRLVNAAGERYRDLIRLINRYEDAMQTGQEQRAEQLLAEINATFDSDEVSGEVAFIIHQARSYRAIVEASLGNEARRFASLLPAFRDHPELVVRQRWLRTYANVLGREDAEIYFVPAATGEIKLALAGLHEVKELRQRLELDRKERESLEQAMEGAGYVIPWARHMQLEGPGRQLRIDGDRVAPKRDPGRPSSR